MTSPILFAGGEDLDLFSPNGWPTVVSSPNNTIDTTSGRFRSGYARYALSANWNQHSNPASFYIPSGLYSSSLFWTTYRVYANTLWSGFGSTYAIHTWYDTSGLARLRIKFNGTNCQFYTVNASGTETQLGGNFSVTGPPALQSNKIDIFINYAVAGQFTVYFNGTSVFSYSGDITTNSVTVLDSKLDFNVWNNATGQSGYFAYSEIIVATRDTRNMSLVTQASMANGNTHNWDGGTATNLASTSETTGDASPNYASSAGLIQEYEVTPALPSGNFSVISVIHKARATAGTSGPTKFDFMIRFAATDYTSPDQSLGSSWITYSYSWDLNPNTLAAWQTSDLAASSTAFNMGLQSVT